MCPKEKYLRWQKKPKAPAAARIPKRPAAWEFIADYLCVPLFIFWCAYQPNFMHGLIDYLEEGQHLSVINEIFHGKIPAKDAFIIYGPLHVYIPALLMIFFGKTLAVLRGYFHFGSIFSLLAAYFLGRQLLRKRLFAYLLAFLLVLEVSHPFWSTRWGGIRMGIGLLSILFLINFVRKKKLVWLFCAGIFAGFSALYSLEIGVFSFACGLLAAALVYFDGKGSRLSSGVKSLAFYIAGVSLVVLPFLAYYSAENALGPYLETVFAVSMGHSRVWKQGVPPFFPKGLNYSNFFSWIFGLNFKLYLPALVYAVAALYISVKLFKKEFTERTAVILILASYGLLSYGVSFRAIDGPQFQIALPPVLILICLFTEHCFGYVRKNIASAFKPRVNYKVLFLSAALIFSLVYLLGSQKRYYFSLGGWFLCQANKDKIMPMYSMPVSLLRIPLVPLEIERAKGILLPQEQKEEVEDWEYPGYPPLLKSTAPLRQ